MQSVVKVMQQFSDTYIMQWIIDSILRVKATFLSTSIESMSNKLNTVFDAGNR